MLKNIGFYIDKVNTENRNIDIFKTLNSSIRRRKIKDASLFYNDIDYNPLIPAFGMFNAADMWNFTGTLFTTSLNNAFSANKIVNKFKLFHIYNRWDDKDILKVLEVANTIDVITEDEEDAKEFYRITGKKPVHQFEHIDAIELLEVLT
tara:strand:- start:146 stop:592 length:447 start_codon:yes stop_codon:yes gene_type:complete